MKNSKIILPLLTLGVITSFYYAWQSSPPVPRDNSAKNSRALTLDSAAGTALDSARFDFSGGEQRRFKPPRRNLFNQLYPPPPAPKKVVRPPVVLPPPVVEAVAESVLPVLPEPILTPASRMPPFQVLGFLAKNKILTAFVSLRGEIYLVKNEQLFADEFRVTELNQEKITIARVSGDGQVSLLLSEKADSSGLTKGPVAGSVARPASQVSHPELSPVLPGLLPLTLPALPPVHPPIDGED